MLMTEFAAERGVPEQTTLRNTGIEPSILRDSTAEIAAGQEMTLLRNIVAELGDAPGLGLLAGRRYHLAAHGIWGFAVASSPTLRDALEVAVRFADLSFSFANLYLRNDPAHLTIVFDDAAVPADIRQFHLERDLAITANLQRDLLPMKLPLLRVELPLIRCPAYEAFAAEYIGDDVVYEAALPTLSVGLPILGFPLPQGQKDTALLYERQCAEVIQRRRSRLGMSGRVRQLLVHHGGTAAQSEIAADLNIAVRTLRRRLADEGTTFRELKDETFGLLAEELLAAGLTVEQVAGRLGYSGASAFAHAFRAWKGEAPGQYARDRVTSRASR